MNETGFKSSGPDHATWLDKVRTELKGRDPAGLDYLWDGEHISPFEEFKLKPRRFWPARTGVWDIDAEIIWSLHPNEQLLNALNLGATSLSLNINQTKPWKSVFKGVHLDWIRHQWYFSTPEHLNTLIHALPKTIVPELQVVCWIPPSEQQHIFYSFQSALPQFRFLSLNSESHQSSKSIASDWTALIDRIWKSTFGIPLDQVLKSVAIQYTAGNDLVLNISMIRAMRWIWKQVLSGFNQDPDSYPLYIAASVRHQNEPATDFMIRASLIAASLVCGGADSVTIAAPDPSQPDPAWGLKAQHIMHYESKLDKIDDPFSGSFVVERLTALIAQKVWQQVKAPDEIG